MPAPTTPSIPPDVNRVNEGWRTFDNELFKKPNEWGQDIFLLQLLGNIPNGITRVKAATYSDYPLVEGAVTTDNMIKNMYK